MVKILMIPLENYLSKLFFRRYAYPAELNFRRYKMFRFPRSGNNVKRMLNFFSVIFAEPFKSLKAYEQNIIVFYLFQFLVH